MKSISIKLVLFFFLFSLNIRAQDYALDWAFNPKDSIVLGGDIYATKSKVNHLTGDIYVIGYFANNANFNLNETYNLSSNGAYDIFLAKYKSNGDLIWAKNVGGGESDYAYDLAIDEEGNIYITGSFRLLVKFDINTPEETVYSNGTSDIFLAKYDSEGSFIWVKSVSSTLNSTGIGLIIDTFGDVYLTGEYKGMATFGGESGTILTSDGNGNIFLAKYDSNGNFFWVKSLGGTSEGKVRAIEINDNNEIFISGIYWANATFQSFSISSVGEADIFLAKFTTEGNCVWVNSMGGSSNDYIYDLAIDSDNNVVIVGRYDEVAYFDPNSNVSLNSSSAFSSVFIAKYTSHGTYTWAKSIENENGTSGYGITIDIDNNVIITGKFYGSNTFNNPSNEELVATGQYNTYIAKYNPNGEYIWAINFNGTSTNSGTNITMDENNNIVLLSQFRDTVNFNYTSINEFYSGLDVSNYVIAKYSSDNGNFIWAQIAGGLDGGSTIQNHQYGADIKVDNEGNVIVAGSFEGKVDFNKSETEQAYLESKGGFDCFIAKYDSDGNYIWAKSFGGNEDDFLNCLTTDEFGNIYIGGSFKDTVDIGLNGLDLMIADVHTVSMFVAQFDSNGNYNWSNYSRADFGGTIANDISLDSENNVYLTGKFRETSNFDINGDATYSSVGLNSDAFIAKYNNQGNFIWLNHIESNSLSQGIAIINDLENNVIVTGSFRQITNFDPQGDANIDPLFDESFFLAKYNSDGDFIWVRVAGGIDTQTDPSTNIGRSIAVDGDGNYFVTGVYTHNIVFTDDSQTISFISSFNPDIFLAKYSPTGTIQWISTYGGDEWDYTNQVVIHNDLVYLTGSFGGTISFHDDDGQQILVSKGNSDGFLANFDLNGNILMSKKIGGYSHDAINSVSVTDDNIYLTGTFYLKIDADPSLSTYELSSLNSSDIFILKLNPCISPEVNISQSGVLLTVEDPTLYYQWYKCNTNGNVLLAGETSQSFTASQNGSYSVMVSEDGCTQWSDCFQVVNVGVEELDVNEILVYPNPTNNKLFVKINASTSLEIYSITGTLIERLDNDNNYVIDVSNYSNGIYLLKSMNQVVKFVKE